LRQRRLGCTGKGDANANRLHGGGGLLHRWGPRPRGGEGDGRGAV